MNALEWLRAHKRGEVRHDWAPITLTDGLHVLKLEVSADAAKVGGYRENIGARGQQLLADAMEAMLPTATILAERHKQATVKLRPITGDITHLTAEQHSDLVDRALARGDVVAKAGAWLVSDVGKSWTIDRLSAENVAIAEGFFLDGAAPHDIFGPSAVPGVLAVRVPGAPQVRAGKHDLHQGDGAGNAPTDYSQKAIFVRRACWLDGAPADLAAIYKDKELCRLVSPDGKPLLDPRHPGVELLADSPEAKLLEAEDAPPDTQPQRGRLPAVKTPVAPAELFDAFKTAAPELGRASILVLLAHWHLETAGGAAVWAYNLGNVKGRPDGSDGFDHAFFACNEVLTPPQTAASLKAATPRELRRAEDDPLAFGPARFNGEALSAAVSSTGAAGDSVVWFFPPHPYACFRAFKSLGEGVAAHMALLRRRFASAWPAVVAGDVAAFGHALRAAHYYTAPEEQYVAGLRQRLAQVSAQIPA